MTAIEPTFPMMAIVYVIGVILTIFICSIINGYLNLSRRGTRNGKLDSDSVSLIAMLWPASVIILIIYGIVKLLILILGYFPNYIGEWLYDITHRINKR